MTVVPTGFNDQGLGLVVLFKRIEHLAESWV